VDRFDASYDRFLGFHNLSLKVCPLFLRLDPFGDHNVLEAVAHVDGAHD
jgi:hypothetical protein